MRYIFSAHKDTKNPRKYDVFEDFCLVVYRTIFFTSLLIVTRYMPRGCVRVEVFYRRIRFCVFGNFGVCKGGRMVRL